MIRKLYTFFQKETVLSISVILAVFSMFWIKPDHTYISYIDFRTLSLLFCLMTIVAGLKEIGVFDFLAEKMLSKALEALLEFSEEGEDHAEHKKTDK